MPRLLRTALRVDDLDLLDARGSTVRLGGQPSVQVLVLMRHRH